MRQKISMGKLIYIRDKALMMTGIISFALAVSCLAAGPDKSPCASDRVLFITDSHGLGPFGELMDRWFVTLPDTELQTYALGGSSPPWWSRRISTPHGYVYNSCDGKPILPRPKAGNYRVYAPNLTELIESGARKYHRQIVVFEQGGNVPGVPENYRSWTSAMVKTVLSKPQNICVWIAPPKMGAVSQKYSERVLLAIAQGIADAAHDLGVSPGQPAPCLLIDSRPFTEYPKFGGDGYHYPYNKAGFEVARRWADAVIARIGKLLGN